MAFRASRLRVLASPAPLGFLRTESVHEIAVLADQRRRAGYALTSDATERWHRYNLPGLHREDEVPASEPLVKTATKLGRRNAATPDTRPRSGRRTREDNFAADSLL